MNESNKIFRDKLLDLEKPSAKHKEKYEKEILAMVEKKLSVYMRIGFAVLGLIGLLVTIGFGSVAFKHASGIGGFLIRVATVPGTILAFAGTVLAVWVAIKGTLNLGTQAPTLAGICLALGFFIITTWMFQFVTPITLEVPVDWRSVFGTQLALIGFFFLITIGLIVILRIIYRVEFKTNEKLLEIEYRLAELAEKLEDKPGK